MVRQQERFGPTLFGGSPRMRLTVFAFIALMLGLLFVERYEVLQEPNRLMGMLFVGLAASHLRDDVRRWSPEGTLYGCFIAWAMASGYLVAGDGGAVSAYVRLLLQTWALVCAVAVVTCMAGHARSVFVLFTLYVAILAVFLFTLGEIDLIQVGSEYRAQSMTNNPNFLGYCGVYGAIATAILWRALARRAWHVGVGLAWLCVNVALVVVSASRKATIALVVFGVLWWLWCSRFLARRRLVGVSLGLVIILVAIVTWTPIAENTALGIRMERAREDPVGDESRMEMYEVGWTLFRDHPLAGVGLGNYRVLSGLDAYSHSEYVEVLSTTGIVGGAIYLALYVVFWRRLSALDGRQGRVDDRYTWRTYKATVVTTAVLGLGGPNFLSPWHMVIMFGMIGHSRAALQAVEAQRPGWEARAGRETGGPAIRTPRGGRP